MYDKLHKTVKFLCLVVHVNKTYKVNEEMPFFELSEYSQTVF